MNVEKAFIQIMISEFARIVVACAKLAQGKNIAYPVITTSICIKAIAKRIARTPPRL